MFSVMCPGHRREVLLTRSNITGLANTVDGVEVHWRCRCGSTGTWFTGAVRTPAAAPLPATHVAA